MKQIDLVIFDMAGTTVIDNNEVENCFWAAAEQTGLITTRERIISMMGWSKRLVFETLWKEQLNEKLNDELEKKIDLSYETFKEILENHYLNSDVQPTQGCLEIFSYLKKSNIKIGLTTGFYRKVTNIILKKLDWSDAVWRNSSALNIDSVVTSDEVSFGRPFPYMVFKTMELTGTSDVRKVIKIGDTPSDLGEGKNAGCKFSFGVTNGTHTHQQLSNYENDGLFTDLNEFNKWLSPVLIC